MRAGVRRMRVGKRRRSDYDRNGERYMEKAAFLRLPGKKRKTILEKGREIYIRYDYDEITIRFLTEKMGMDMATFYRYFENKDDLVVCAYRDLISRTKYEEYPPICRFINEYEDRTDQEFFAVCRRMTNKTIRDRLMEAERDVIYPIIRQQLRAEKYKGTIRDEVDVDLIAYLYSSIGTELFDFFEKHQITDQDLQEKMKQYVYFSFFMHGIAEEKNA